MKKKKTYNVCIVVQNYYSEDPRVRREAKALLSHGHKISIISLHRPGEPKQETIDGVKIYRGALQKKRLGTVRYLIEYLTFFLYAMLEINRLDLNEKIDVVQICTLPDVLVFCALIQKLKGRKIILDMHEIMPEFFMSKFKVSKENLIIYILLFLEKISLKFADRVITVNEPIKNIFQERAIPKTHIEVVMNTLDESLVKKNRKRIHQGFNCVYHGTITDIYGLEVAIKGVYKAYKKGIDIVFHIFGSGPQINYLKNLVKELNFEQSVVFHSRLKHYDMIEWLQEMDLGILAYRKDAFLDLCFSNKLAEYIYLKIPVLSSDLYTTRYYFNDKSILYFEAGNVDQLSQKIVFAYRNRDHIRTMAEEALKNYQNLKWTIMAERYLQVVEGCYPQ